MQVKEIKSEGLKREFSLIIPAQTIQKSVHERLAGFAKNANMPGFRKGKVPLNVLEKKYGPQAEQDALSDMTKEGVNKILGDNKLKAAMQPELRDIDYKPGSDLACTVFFEVVPDIKLLDYKTFKIEKLSVKPDAEAINKVQSDMALRFGSFVDVEKKRPIQKGDFAVINLKTLVEGKEVASAGAQDFYLEIGASMLPGKLDQAVEGKSIGDTVEVDFTFPTNFAKDLAGKKSKYVAEITALKMKEPAKIDDDLAKKIGYKDLKDFNTDIETRLQKALNEDAFLVLKRNVLDALDKNLKFDLPESLVDAEFQSIWNQHLRHDHSSHEHNADGSCKIDAKESKEDEKLKKQYREIAERRVKLGLYLAEVGQENKIRVSEEEIKQALFMEVQKYPGQQDQVLEYYRSNPQAMANLRAPIFENHVINFIADQSTIVEKSIKSSELKDLIEKMDT